jgi:choline-sulfatase
MRAGEMTSVVAARADDGPSILWIFADELRADTLGCAGGPHWRVATPHVDRLAAAGTMFRNAFCNSPACVPARTAILTGTHPQANGVHGNEGAWASFPTPVRFETFPERFAAAGWRTATFGKSHAARGYAPWQEENGEGGGMHVFGLDRDPAPLAPIVPRGIPSPVGGVFPDRAFFPPEAVTINALDWLDRNAGAGRFLLRVSYLQPHTPVLPPQRFRRLYRAADFPGHAIGGGMTSAFEDAFAAMVGGRELSDDEMRQAQADYCALVTWLDAQIGMLLAKIDLLGLRGRTIVVFDSDHGASLGENGLLSKIVFAPQSHRIPRLIAWPGTLPAASTRDDLVQGIDLGPTLCHLAGIDPPAQMRGRALFRDPPPEAIFASVGSGARGARASSAAQKGLWRNGGGWPRRGCIRTDRFRLDMNIRQDDGPMPPGEADIFLADWRADPLERTDLAADPAHEAIRDALAARLDAFMARSLEPDFVPAFAPGEAPEFAPPRIGAAPQP